MNYPSREDFDPYFYDPEGERDAQARRDHMYDNDDWEFDAMREWEEAEDQRAVHAVGAGGTA